jgi:hypothetical protein
MPKYAPQAEAQAKQQLPINILALNNKLAPLKITAELGGKTKRRTADPKTGKDLSGCEAFQKIEFSGALSERDEVHHGNVDPDYRAYVESKDPTVAAAGKLHDAGAAYDAHSDFHPKSKDRTPVWYYEQHPVELNQFIVSLIAAL